MEWKRDEVSRYAELWRKGTIFSRMAALFVSHEGHFAPSSRLALRENLAPHNTHSVGRTTLEIERDDFLKTDYVIQLGMAPNRIDLLTGIDGTTWEECWSSRISFELDGLAVEVIGKEPLIKNKLATGRTQDLADAERLQQS